MNKDEIYHAHKLREHRRMGKSGVFFVTKCLKTRSPQSQFSLIKTLSMVEDKCCVDIITETLCHTVETGKIKLAAFVVMPDHWHALFGVGVGYSDNVGVTSQSRTGNSLNVGATSQSRTGNSLNVGATSQSRTGNIRNQAVAPTLNTAPTLPYVMKSITNWVSKQYNKSSEYKIDWQPGYHETRIRNNKQFSYICNYIELNPVRQQLIENIESWQWSSANKSFKQHLTRPWPWKFEKES